MRVAVVIELTDEERTTLMKWSRARSGEVRKAQRAKIVLLAAEGLQNREIAEQLGMATHTVGRWRKRFAVDRLKGVEADAPRTGRPASAEITSQILKTTIEQKPPAAATHWSTRTLSEKLGTSHSTVQRVWKKHNLQPHRTKTFKLSNDPRFEEKLTDVVGLYLSPPEHAIVLSVDEKSQIQALNRTQKSLPLFPGRLGTMTHDYKRNGTTTLFAALNVADGTVLADFKSKHRHVEWLDFLKSIEEAYPDGDLHIICDNYATHKHEKVRRWLKRRLRFHIHFTPTSGSWLNLVERWFRDLTEKTIRRGSFHSVSELESSIWEYIEASNENPRPFSWTAQPDKILAKVAKARAALNNVQD